MLEGGPTPFVKGELEGRVSGGLKGWLEGSGRVPPLPPRLRRVDALKGWLKGGLNGGLKA